MYTSPARPVPVRTTPPTSSGGAELVGLAGTTLVPTRSATTPRGTLIRNSHRQLAYVVIRPPASGAITGATRAGQTM